MSPYWDECWEGDCTLKLTYSTGEGGWGDNSFRMTVNTVRGSTGLGVEWRAGEVVVELL